MYLTTDEQYKAFKSKPYFVQNSYLISSKDNLPTILTKYGSSSVFENYAEYDKAIDDFVATIPLQYGDCVIFESDNPCTEGVKATRSLLAHIGTKLTKRKYGESKMLQLSPEEYAEHERNWEFAEKVQKDLEAALLEHQAKIDSGEYDMDTDFTYPQNGFDYSVCDIELDFHEKE